ncbi:MAG: extracellular solute-binding protein [Bacillota bacterium]|nr:extracellular solute-binding protein [Bacillota bacterium]
MKNPTNYLLIIFLCFFTLTSCSFNKKILSVNETQDAGNIKAQADENVKKTVSNSNTLTVWGYDENWLSYRQTLTGKYPNLELKFIQSEGDITDELMEKIAQGNAPDVVLMRGEFKGLGKLHYIDGVENLLEAPYNAKDMMGNFTKSQLSLVMTPDGKRMDAIPMIQYPSMAYYREDILKQYGFPTDPVELGKFMEKPDNWIAIARELKKHDKWIMQWRSEPLDIYCKNWGYFDNNMNYIRNTPDIAKMLYTIRIIKAEELAPFIGIWESAGQEAIRNGKMAMVYLGSWGEDKLKEWAPETAGKWRVTKLPFNANGFDGSSALVITKNSEHKKEAWELIKMIVADEKKHFDIMVNQKSDFLGGQYAQRLYNEQRKKIPNNYYTPLDARLDGMWTTETRNYYEYTYKDMDDFQALKVIQGNINYSFKNEIDILANYLKSKNNN